MEESTLSSYEFACIVGQYNGLSSKDRIDPRLLERGYTPEQIAIMEKKTLGSTESVISCGLRITSDLKEITHDSFNYYISMFNAYNDHGHLPFPGSYSEQPAKIIEVLDAFTQLNFEREMRMHKEQERENKGK